MSGAPGLARRFAKRDNSHTFCRRQPLARARYCPAVRAVRGFTLVELMIAVVVLGILASIALPSFLESIRKSRRSEAATALMQIQQAQERWRSNRAAYASDLAGLGLAGQTPGGYYALSIEDADATGYTATAVGKTGTSQAQDAQCRTMRVRLTGGNLTYAGCGGEDCGTFAATHPCWAQ